MIAAIALTVLALIALYRAVEWYNSIPRMWVLMRAPFDGTRAYYLRYKVVGESIIVCLYGDWQVVDGSNIKRLEGMVR